MPTATPRTQAQRREATRALLLDAAGTVFAGHGYHRATLGEIARAAGVSKGGLYHHFASKEDLFLALLEQRLDLRLAEIALSLNPDDAAARFQSAAEGDPRWTPLLFEFIACSARDPHLRARFRDRFLRRVRENVTPLLEKRLGIDHQQATELTIALDALGNGMMLERVFDRQAVPDDLLGRAMAALVEGLGRG